jgi:hypothetical protein
MVGLFQHHDQNFCRRFVDELYICKLPLEEPVPLTFPREECVQVPLQVGALFSLCIFLFPGHFHSVSCTLSQHGIQMLKTMQQETLPPWSRGGGVGFFSVPPLGTSHCLK